MQGDHRLLVVQYHGVMVHGSVSHLARLSCKDREETRLSWGSVSVRTLDFSWPRLFNCADVLYPHARRARGVGQ